MIQTQKTLKKAIHFQGIGLHTGKEAKVTVRPAHENHGIVFVRADLESKIRIPALSTYVVDTTLSTTLGKEGVTIATIEHLMAALWGMGVDNALIEVYGPEIPIMDGSSEPFVKQIKRKGLKDQSAFRKFFILTEPISVIEGDRYCYFLSQKISKLTSSIDFAHPAIGKQKYEVKIDRKNFMLRLSKARTFGFLKEVETLRQKGLIAGGALDNAIVLDEKGVINPEGLRFHDEFVRHKALDALGDMALFGIRILGHLVTHKAGHELHYRLMRKLMTSACGYVFDPIRKAQKERTCEAVTSGLIQPTIA